MKLVVRIKLLQNGYSVCLELFSNVTNESLIILFLTLNKRIKSNIGRPEVYRLGSNSQFETYFTFRTSQNFLYLFN